MKRTVLGQFVKRNSGLNDSIDEETRLQTQSLKLVINADSYNSPANNENSFSPSFTLRRLDTTSFYSTPASLKFSRRRTSFVPDGDYFAKYRIPGTVLLNIFSYLNKRDLISAMRTCKKFHSVTHDPSLWLSINLANKHVTEQQIHLLLNRKTQVLRLSEAKILNSENIPLAVQSVMQPSRLTHLDLSYAKFENIETLVNLLSRCSFLECLSLESCEINNSVCLEIGKNRKLKCLNMVMVSGLSPRGLNAITSQCTQLFELNLGWTKLSDETINILVRTVPKFLQKLNISGPSRDVNLKDNDVKILCQRCHSLEELDLSDNDAITEKSLTMIRDLPSIRKLNLARCYKIEPHYYLTLGRLEELNIFDCVTEDGISYLRNKLENVNINTSIFSTIARPTVGESITSIWGMRTRDLY